MQEKKQITCVRCLGKFDADLEFCPHCKSPALWSSADFQQARQAKNAGLNDIAKMEADWGQDHTYQEMTSKEDDTHKPKRDYTKILLIVAVIIVIGISMYYLWDKNNNQPTAEEIAAIELVQQSEVLEVGTTVKDLFAELDQSTTDYVRVIGWQAKQIENSVYFVSYVVDNDMSDGNGNQQYFFEADIATGRVTAPNTELIAKYEALGFLK